MYERIPFFERGWMFVCREKEKGSSYKRVKRDDRMDAVMDTLIRDKSVPPINVSRFSCKLRGRVHGKEGFEEGDLIETSIVKTIEPEPYSDWFVVTTSKGSKYRILHDRFYTTIFGPR